MYSLDKLRHILVGAVTRGYLLIVPYVIARVPKRRIVNRVQPYSVTAELFNIIQLFYNTLYIPYSVTVAVVKALGINLVENRVFLTISAYFSSPFLCHVISISSTSSILT